MTKVALASFNSKAILLLLVLNGCHAMFNRLTAQHADCSDAILLTDTFYRQVLPLRGFGKVRELVQSKSLDSTAFARESNSLWLKFHISEPSYFEFELTPDQARDDYDFVLFPAPSSNASEQVKSLTGITLIRSNISRNDPLIRSRTGISLAASNIKQKIGKGESFCARPVLDEGDYFLVIDAARTPLGGFVIKTRIEPIPKPQPPVVVLPPAPARLKISFTDSARTGVPMRLTLNYPGLGIDFLRTDSSAYHFPLKDTLVISGSAKGFFPFFGVFATDSDSSSIDEVIVLNPLREESNARIGNIFFEGNTAVFLPGSEHALLALVEFMNLNPGLKIEIQGHVNGPGQRNIREFRRLSEDRAREIRDFLVFNNVSKRRISVEGYGNSRMIYPMPTTAYESEQNRRVEIMVKRYDPEEVFQVSTANGNSGSE